MFIIIIQTHSNHTLPHQIARLREFPGNTSCLSLPAFTFIYEPPSGSASNPFLVILNAEIMSKDIAGSLNHKPPSIPLQDDIQQLTIELVELLYWRPLRAGNDGRDPEVVRRRHRHDGFLGQKMQTWKHGGR